MFLIFGVRSALRVLCRGSFARVDRGLGTHPTDGALMPHNLRSHFQHPATQNVSLARVVIVHRSYEQVSTAAKVVGGWRPERGRKRVLLGAAVIGVSASHQDLLCPWGKHMQPSRRSNELIRLRPK